MGSRKRPRNKTWNVVLVTDSIVLTLLISFYCLSQKRFVYVQINEPLALMFCITSYYSKFDQEVNAFM